MYAIIATGGKQYKVAEGDVIRVEKLGVEAGAEVVFDQVLVVSGDEVKVGDPTVAGATVTATAVGDGKAKKVIVYKYKKKLAIIRRTVIDRLIQKLRLKRSTLNFEVM